MSFKGKFIRIVAEFLNDYSKIDFDQMLGQLPFKPTENKNINEVLLFNCKLLDNFPRSGMITELIITNVGPSDEDLIQL